MSRSATQRKRRNRSKVGMDVVPQQPDAALLERVPLPAVSIVDLVVPDQETVPVAAAAATEDEAKSANFAHLDIMQQVAEELAEQELDPQTATTSDYVDEQRAEERERWLSEEAQTWAPVIERVLMTSALDHLRHHQDINNYVLTLDDRLRRIEILLGLRPVPQT